MLCTTVYGYITCFIDIVDEYARIVAKASEKRCVGRLKAQVSPSNDCRRPPERNAARCSRKIVAFVATVRLYECVQFRRNVFCSPACLSFVPSDCEIMVHAAYLPTTIYRFNNLSYVNAKVLLLYLNCKIYFFEFLESNHYTIYFTECISYFIA